MLGRLMDTMVMESGQQVSGQLIKMAQSLTKAIESFVRISQNTIKAPAVVKNLHLVSTDGIYKTYVDLSSGSSDAARLKEVIEESLESKSADDGFALRTNPTILLTPTDGSNFFIVDQTQQAVPLVFQTVVGLGAPLSVYIGLVAADGMAISPFQVVNQATGQVVATSSPAKAVSTQTSFDGALPVTYQNGLFTFVVFDAVAGTQNYFIQNVEAITGNMIPIAIGNAFLTPKKTICQPAGSPYFVVTNPPYTYSQSNAGCNQLGAFDTEPVIFNFLEVANVVYTCLGPYSSAWVGGWNTDDYNEAPLKIFTGAVAGGGAIAVLSDATGTAPYVCTN